MTQLPYVARKGHLKRVWQVFKEDGLAGAIDYDLTIARMRRPALNVALQSLHGRVSSTTFGKNMMRKYDGQGSLTAVRFEPQYPDDMFHPTWHWQYARKQ